MPRLSVETRSFRQSLRIRICTAGIPAGSMILCRSTSHRSNRLWRAIRRGCTACIPSAVASTSICRLDADRNRIPATITVQQMMTAGCLTSERALPSHLPLELMGIAALHPPGASTLCGSRLKRRLVCEVPRPEGAAARSCEFEGDVRHRHYLPLRFR